MNDLVIPITPTREVELVEHWRNCLLGSTVVLKRPTADPKRRIDGTVIERSFCQAGAQRRPGAGWPLAGIRKADVTNGGRGATTTGICLRLQVPSS